MFHIVDDEDMFREVLVNLAEALGHQAIPFASALHYLEHFNSEDYIKPTAVITDVRMPGMNGYELMGYIGISHPEINFVIMSGETRIEHEHMDKACMYLKKPFEANVFHELLNKLKRCEREGASVEIGCAEFGDREYFGVSECVCPKACR